MHSLPFSDLPLSSAMLANLDKLGFKQMTAIQAQSLPTILDNKDVIAQAKTGSGKTAAFGIGTLSKLDHKQFQVQSLILCPTRELAEQVAEALRQLAKFSQNIKILTLCGGVPVHPQQSALKHGVHIVVGTPGRVLKHLKDRRLKLETLNTCVLDEADRMLDMGFQEDIYKIIEQMPKQRQTLLFSATYPEGIQSLSQTIQTHAERITVENEAKSNSINEYFYQIASTDKLSGLIHLLAHHQPNNVIIFSNTKAQAQKIAAQLRAENIHALAIHGDLEQFQRTDVIVQFANQSCPVLVATDVAARGIDIKALSMVVNYDMPHDQTIYTHRIGRTARAGETGLAVSLATEQEARAYQEAEREFSHSLPPKSPAPYRLQAQKQTLLIKGGKKHKIRPGDILGALTKEGGIAGKHVGKIHCDSQQSYVAIEKALLEKAYKHLKNSRIKGRKFPIIPLR